MAANWVSAVQDAVNALDGSALATTFGLLNRASCEWRAFPAFAASGAQGAQEVAARDHMLGGADDDC